MHDRTNCVYSGSQIPLWKPDTQFRHHEKLKKLANEAPCYKWGNKTQKILINGSPRLTTKKTICTNLIPHRPTARFFIS